MKRIEPASWDGHLTSCLECMQSIGPRRVAGWSFDWLLVGHARAGLCDECAVQVAAQVAEQLSKGGSEPSPEGR